MKPKSLDKAGKKLMAEIDKEMNLPRLTESVREHNESVGNTDPQEPRKEPLGSP